MQIKLGLHMYQIIYLPGVYTEDGTAVFGIINFQRREIKIEGRNPPRKRRQTLWHEIVHAIWPKWAAENQDDLLVDRLAWNLMQVIEDNPWLAESVE